MWSQGTCEDLLSVCKNGRAFYWGAGWGEGGGAEGGAWGDVRLEGSLIRWGQPPSHFFERLAGQSQVRL